MNRYLFKLQLIIVSIVLCNCSGKKTINDIWVNWGVETHSYNNQELVRSAFTIINKGKGELKNGWSLYFNLPRMVVQDSNNSITGNVNIVHVNGDLFKIVPQESFQLKAGDSVRIEFTAEYWLINFSDAPSGLYMVYENEGKEEAPEPIAHYKILPFVKEAQYKRRNDDVVPMPTASSRYNENAGLTLLSKDELLPVIPAPVEYKYGKSLININSEYSINASSDLNKESEFLEHSLNKLLSSPLKKSGTKKIELKLGKISDKRQIYSYGAEAYQLSVKDGNIVIVGSDKDGLFYGIQTFLALLPVEAWDKPMVDLSLKEIDILDYPRFHYRGMYLDVARNFKDKKSILKLLDVMSFYKLNKFHFHISDDEGWRVEIDGLPELTGVGAYRKHDASGKGIIPSYGSGPFADPKKNSGSGYYSKNEFIEIIKYAHDRHIEVIPEVDMPGHIRAAIVSMNARYDKYMKKGDKLEAEKYLLRDLNDSSKYLSVQLWNDNTVCPCIDGPYNFLDKVVTELKNMYTKAGVPMRSFHIGGDEVAAGVWEESPACRKIIGKVAGVNSTHDLFKNFEKRVMGIVAKHGLNIQGWEEVGLMAHKTIHPDGSESVDHIPNPEFSDKGITVNYWNSTPGNNTEDHGYKLANAGYKVIMSNVNYLYFDMAYNRDPEETGYYWGSFVNSRKPFEFIPLDYYKGTDYDRMGNKLDKEKVFGNKEVLTKVGKENIIGIQGQLWGETVISSDIMEYLIYPRLLSLAQRAWSPDPAWAREKDDKKRIQMMNVDWNVFANTLGQREFERLDLIDGGVNYAIPQPGAVNENDTLKANVAFPGLIIRYTLDGTDPNVNSTVYSNPIAIKGVNSVRLKSFSRKGRESRVSLLE